MSKLVAAVVATGGSAATSVGGNYLLQQGSGREKGTDTTSSKATVSITSELNFPSLFDFKKEKGGSCAKHYFGELNYGIEESSIDSNNAVVADDFLRATLTGTDPKGCLVVNWERTDAQASADDANKKWTGNFRWLWSFVNGNKGFVIFYTTKLSATDNQFDLEGGIYFVTKESGEGKNWKIGKYKEVNGVSKHIKDDNFESAFPKVGDSFEGVQSSEKPNWGFMSSKEDLKTLCKKEDSTTCPTGTTEKKSDFKEVREWKNDSSLSNTPDQWSSTLSASLTNLFGDADGLNMSSSFTNFKGSWKRQTAGNSN